jgi:hypothetical protein
LNLSAKKKESHLQEVNFNISDIKSKFPKLEESQDLLLLNKMTMPATDFLLWTETPDAACDISCQWLRVKD